jgi:hypothetical protein
MAQLSAGAMLRQPVRVVNRRQTGRVRVLTDQARRDGDILPAARPAGRPKLRRHSIRGEPADDRAGSASPSTARATAAGDPENRSRRRSVTESSGMGASPAPPDEGSDDEEPDRCRTVPRAGCLLRRSAVRGALDLSGDRQHVLSHRHGRGRDARAHSLRDAARAEPARHRGARRARPGSAPARDLRTLGRDVPGAPVAPAAADGADGAQLRRDRGARLRRRLHGARGGRDRLPPHARSSSWSATTTRSWRSRTTPARASSPAPAR